jgi:hypothetical protein
MARRLAWTLVVASLGACAAPDLEDDADGHASAITDVPHTPVERQAIGNCWIYAEATWAESMHLAATGEAFDVSQSYWTYWHWYEQILTSEWGEIDTGGSFGTAARLVRKYGVVAERDFVPGDDDTETAVRQKQALDAMNRSLTTGALSTEEARGDAKLVRHELDVAWGLAPDVVRTLDRVFGAPVERGFDGRSPPADASGTKILPASDFAVAYTTSPGAAPVRKTLLDAMGDWRTESFRVTEDRRAFYGRVQRALHDRQPVLVTWFVDFNALENRANERRGSFNMTTLRELGPGSQGGHMTVLEDYEAELADGTLLRAGETLDPAVPAQAALLTKALEPATKVRFLRVKNSWGNARPDRAFAPGMPGYHDLTTDYLEGPVKSCREKDGRVDLTTCQDGTVPLQDVILPPGY